MTEAELREIESKLEHECRIRATTLSAELNNDGGVEPTRGGSGLRAVRAMRSLQQQSFPPPALAGPIRPGALRHRHRGGGPEHSDEQEEQERSFHGDGPDAERLSEQSTWRSLDGELGGHAPPSSLSPSRSPGESPRSVRLARTHREGGGLIGVAVTKGPRGMVGRGGQGGVGGLGGLGRLGGPGGPGGHGGVNLAGFGGPLGLPPVGPSFGENIAGGGNTLDGFGGFPGDAGDLLGAVPCDSCDSFEGGREGREGREGRDGKVEDNNDRDDPVARSAVAETTQRGGSSSSSSSSSNRSSSSGRPAKAPKSKRRAALEDALDEQFFTW